MYIVSSYATYIDSISVVCAFLFTYLRSIGTSNLPYHYERFRCVGTEATLDDCVKQSNPTCASGRDSGIICTNLQGRSRFTMSILVVQMCIFIGAVYDFCVFSQGVVPPDHTGRWLLQTLPAHCVLSGLINSDPISYHASHVQEGGQHLEKEQQVEESVMVRIIHV